ncbi:MAG: hypothetical protein ACXACK_00280 [Candidatus Hodarchaeales archaeon]|jgi:hypothetical protein
MNDQDEILVRKSKWSGRRAILFYWFAIVFVGTAAAAGLGATILDPKFKFEAADDPWHAAIEDPWHADDCAGSGCHDDVIAEWSESWHSKLVGEYDITDITKNGSKMSYNTTHFWRTPNTPANESDLTDMSNIEYWTYNQLYNASGRECCMTTRWTNVTEINATTGEVLWVTSDPALENFTSNIWDIGVSCAACHSQPGVKSLSYSSCGGGAFPPCHTPGGGQWSAYRASEHYNSLSDLLASGDINSLTNMQHYVGQSTYMNVADMNASDYYTITCATCHDPHDASINAAQVGSEENHFSPWTNPYTGEVFGPGGSMLRFATTNELCGQCHTISFNTSTRYFTDPSNHSSLACTDCHGYQFVPGHNATDRFGNVNWVNATFSSLSHDWVAPNDADDCALCHGDENATVWNDMQAYLNQFGNLTDAKALYDTKLAEATSKYSDAKSTVGVDTSNLENANSLIEEAKGLVPNDGTFHNPLSPTAEEQLSLALVKLDEAIDEADAAIAAAVNPTVTVDHTDTVDVTVDHTVDHTVDKSITVPTTVIQTAKDTVGFLAAIGILGIVAVLFNRKRR